MRESFIFYKSFYDSIKELDPKDQVLIYNAIFEHQFYGNEVELNNVSKSIFKLIIPLLEANNKRYENGKKGGAPKGNQNARKYKKEETTKNNPKQPKNKVMYNDNVLCIMNNDNVLSSNSGLFDYVEQCLGRTLNGVEFEIINKWDDNELTRYAIQQAMLNGGRSIKYIQTILNSYKTKGIYSVEDAMKDKKKGNTPTWFDKDQKYEKASEEDIKELGDLLKEFN